MLKSNILKPAVLCQPKNVYNSHAELDFETAPFIYFFNLKSETN